MIKEINFSKKAVERINQLISSKPEGTFFRIAVKGGGCSGFKYDFSFDSIIDKNLTCIKNILTPNDQMPLFNGGVEEDLSKFNKFTIDKYSTHLFDGAKC